MCNKLKQPIDTEYGDVDSEGNDVDWGYYEACLHAPIARTLDGNCMDCGEFVSKMV